MGVVRRRRTTPRPSPDPVDDLAAARPPALVAVDPRLVAARPPVDRARRRAGGRAVDRVAARPAADDVGAKAGVDRVAARAAAQAVAVAAAVERVVARAADDPVRALRAGEDVAPGAAVDAVASAPAGDAVVAAAHDEPVGAVGAGDAVVALRADDRVARPRAGEAAAGGAVALAGGAQLDDLAARGAGERAADLDLTRRRVVVGAGRDDADA